MSEIFEGHDSRVETISWREPEAELTLHAIGYTDPATLRMAVLSAIPPLYSGANENLVYRNYTQTPLGAGVWQIKARYGRHKNVYKVHIHIGGERGKLLTALETKEMFCVMDDELSSPVDFEKAINVQGDKIEGCEIWLKGGGWMTLQWSAEFADLSSEYCTTLKNLQGHSNEQAVIFNWFGQDFFFDVNELVLTDVDFGQSSDSGIEFALKFDVQQTRENIIIGDLSDISKQGQDFLWVRSSKRKDATSGLVRNIPHAYYTEKVYELADFGELGVFDLIDGQMANVPEGVLA